MGRMSSCSNYALPTNATSIRRGGQLSDFLPSGFPEDEAGYLALGLLGLLMTAGIWYPLKNRGIPNTLALVGASAALLLQQCLPPAQAISGALPGTVGALAGLTLAATAFLPLYLTGATTGSDVKLIAMVGALLGPVDVSGAILFTLLAGSLLTFLCNVRSRGETRAVPCAIALGTAAWILLKG